MATMDRSDIVNMGGNLLNTNSEMDNGDDIQMETDDDDLRSLVKDDDDNKSVNDEAEEGELVDCKDEGLDGDPVFDEHRPLSRPDFPLSEPGKPFLKKLILEENVFNPAKTTFENRSGGFVTGVDIFSAEEQEKLTKRAQRFDINPSEAKTLTQRLLKSLYKSMGVTPGDENIRFDTLHMRGTEEMNTQDVFVYFKDYAPASIEWLNTSSCNVMWLDEVSAARALLGLSVRIKNIKSKESSVKRRKTIDNDSVEDATMDEEEDESDKDSGAENEESDAVSISDISVPIPPGLWRKGVTHPRSKCIFLRFATLEDRRTQRVGRAPSQDFEGYIGLISESKKRRMQEQLGGIVFYDTGDEVFDKKVPEEADNPWSAIAYSWGAFDRNRNKIRHDSPPKRPTPPPSPVYMSRYDRPILRPELWDMKKRKYTDLDAGHSSGSEDWVKRRKLPRMRMHADDEVMQVEKRLRHGSKRHSERRSDLRTRLDDREMIIIKKEKSSSSKDGSEEEAENEPVQQEDEEVPDLRVAVVTDRSPSPEDNKEDVWKSGQVKSVLRGARAHDTHSNHRSDSGDDRRVRSSVRKHRSRSRERHHRSRRRKESSRRHHSRSSGVVLYSERDTDRRHGSSKQYEEYDSDEVAVQPNAQDLRAKISKKKKRDHDGDRHHRTRSHKDRVSDRRRRSDSGERRRSDSGERRRSISKDRDTTFRPKSPLQIEIDNDEYYKLIESD